MYIDSVCGGLGLATQIVSWSPVVRSSIVKEVFHFPKILDFLSLPFNRAYPSTSKAPFPVQPLLLNSTMQTSPVYKFLDVIVPWLSIYISPKIILLADEFGLSIIKCSFVFFNLTF